MLSPVRSLSFMLERIEQFHIEFPEVANVSRRHRQSVHPRRRRDHGVLDQSVRLAMLETRPLPKGGRIHRQNAVTGGQPGRARFPAPAPSPCPARA